MSHNRTPSIYAPLLCHAMERVVHWCIFADEQAQTAEWSRGKWEVTNNNRHEREEASRR